MPNELDLVPFEAPNFCRVVGEQAHAPHTKAEQHLVGGDLIGEADAASFLPEIEQYVTAMLLQEPQTIAQLFSAVATRRPENVARQTFQVNPDQNRLAVVDLSYGERHVLFALGGAVDGNESEDSPGQPFSSLPPHRSLSSVRSLNEPFIICQV